MTSPDLHDFVDRLPACPGVYLMKDGAGSILYIGKAVNLRNRVRSYFSQTHDGRFQIPALMRKVESIDWIATTSETEALIVEANLIREHKPPYNIDLKDDKHFPYLKLTLNEPFPRLLTTRRVLADKARYFGPYPDAATMQKVAAFSRTTFKLRRCSLSLPLSRPHRPCLYHSIGQCSAPCAGKISLEAYTEQVQMCDKFLSGRRSEVIESLQKRMATASESLAFEEAASLRDQIELIKTTPCMQVVDLKDAAAHVDVFGFADDGRTRCLCVLSIRQGVLIATRRFLFSRAGSELGAEIIEESVTRYYQDHAADPPRELLLPGQAHTSEQQISGWFKSSLHTSVSLRFPHKGRKVRLLEMADNNAALFLAQRIPTDNLQDLESLQTLLHLPRLPAVIEAFDISNLGAQDAVAGMVQFVNGQAHKPGYRRFRIRSVSGQNDFAMLIEAVTRRLGRLRDEAKPFPDLLLIDGGLGQLHAAMQPLQAFENPPMIMALAKQEETLYTPWLEHGVRLASNHPVRRLVERIRDEVHRWSITYHRSLRDKKYSRSALENIPGLGPARCRLLLRHFGSLRRLAQADVDQICQVRGISRPLAATIHATLTASSTPHQQ